MDDDATDEASINLWRMLTPSQIDITNRVVVRRGKRVLFTAASEEIEVVAVMSTAEERPPLLSWIPVRSPQLWLVVLYKADRGYGLARIDHGFPELIAWLAAQGWAMDEAITRSHDHIFMRQAVQRTR